MLECKPVRAPMHGSNKLVKSVSNTCEYPFREIVGCLMYSMLGSRPACSVGKLAQFLVCFDETHWTAAKHVLGYLEGTINFGIKYSPAADSHFYGYCDADYAGDLDSGRSTSGYLFIMSGGAISWMSCVQRIVALSTAEAEYIALAESAKEVFWLRQLLSDMGFKQAATRILCDNQGAI
ncbi:gag-pol polyprotein-like protein, partial [Leptotrombidium deliense]